MPIYEYTCDGCQSKFEELVRTMSGGEESSRCPKCGSMKTARALSVFAVGGEAGKSLPISSSPGMCGRCGGPGPCAAGGDF